MKSQIFLLCVVAAVAAFPQQGQDQTSEIIRQALNSEAVQNVFKEISSVTQTLQSDRPFEGIKKINSLAFDAALQASPPDRRQEIQNSQGLIVSILDAVDKFIADLPANSTAIPPINIPQIPPIQIPAIPPILIPGLPPIQIPGVTTDKPQASSSPSSGHNRF
ncbi:uncharacterized protein LOC108664303 [Hyalella azteca]|uniref:Uncharacterized protein LOC108664303 n=1 Tax=Hyalella azteca TaxID=294128 RepID=A0A8B7MXY1_HYAAZ|nr:uncharacterized protein LOC108664303 [Hyalella azteca]